MRNKIVGAVVALCMVFGFATFSFAQFSAQADKSFDRNIITKTLPPTPDKAPLPPKSPLSPQTITFTDINAGLAAVSYSSVAWGDYDNDGYLDILLTGMVSSNPAVYISKIYHNNGNGTFTENINAILAGVAYSSVAWGDYDNDGYLDILLAGAIPAPYSSTPTSKVYHNNGNGTFTENVNAGLIGVFRGSVAWGDYDNDGWLDILLTGNIDGGGPWVPISKIYHNNADGTFTDINANLKNVMLSSVAWGDYDKDGWLDVLLTGWTATGSSGFVSRLYRNNSNGTFTEMVVFPIGLYDSSIAWGDYDNDGDLDVLLTGNAELAGGYISRVYRNNSNGTFTLINAGLAGVCGSAVWGDYDNDGYLDILLTGRVWQSTDTSKIYHNNGNATFTDINAGLANVGYSSVAWGDYDNDGDLDIVWTGQNSSTGASSSIVYQNQGGSANTVPSAPSGLNATVSGSNVTLDWQPATDSQTLQNGLNYNIFIGTAPNLVDKLSPMAQLNNGWRKISCIGSVQGHAKFIEGLAYGTYYWGVQAIDAALAGSPFMTGTFVVGGCIISGKATVNGQGLAGVEIKEGNAILATTPSSGLYSFSKSQGWSGTITPSKAGYIFTPIVRAYNNVTVNQTNQDYATYSHVISGKIVSFDGYGVSGVQIKDGSTVLATTVSNGTYSFTKPQGWSGTITPSKLDHAFIPAGKTYTNLTVDQVNQNYKIHFKLNTFRHDSIL